jgi:hypothetical protein
MQPLRPAAVLAALVLAGCAGSAPPGKEKEAMSCCGTDSKSAPALACCAPTPTTQTKLPVARRVEVEFLHLDLNVCERCTGAEKSLAEAVEEARTLLAPMGIEVTLNLVHVRTEAEAKRLAFVSSPTVRINGRDAAIEVRENACSSCSDLGGADIVCRVWTWRGGDCNIPPKALLLDAILREVYLHEASPRRLPSALETLPENLRKFFKGVQTR